jgi:hypothetical protein
MSFAALVGPMLMMQAPPIEASGGMSEARLTWHLDNWGEDERRDEPIGVGFPERVPLLSSSYAYGDTFDELVERADRRCAEAVRATVYSLPDIQQKVLINRHVDGQAVYRTGRACSMQYHYDQARAAVRKGLIQRGIV